MKLLKRIVVVVILIFAILIGLAIYNKDKIIRAAADMAEESMNAQIDYSSSHISLFQAFPNLGLSVDSFSLQHNSDTRPIFKCNTFGIGLPWSSIFSSSNLHIKSIYLEGAETLIYCNQDSFCNYEYFTSSETAAGQDSTASSSEGSLEIESFVIESSDFKYVDSAAGVVLITEDLDFKMSGKYEGSKFLAEMDQFDMILTYLTGNIAYANKVEVQGEGDIVFDGQNQTIDLQNHDWVFNELHLLFSLYTAIFEDKTDVDMHFEVPENSFKPLLSLIPAFYNDAYKDTEVKGVFNLKGDIKGAYITDDDAYPSIDIAAQIKDGYIKQADLPNAMENLSLNMNIRKPQGSMDLMEIQLPNFAFQMGQNTSLDAHLVLAKLLSNPHFDGHLKLNTLFQDWKDFIAFDGLEILQGKLNTDTKFKFNQDDLLNGNYAAVALTGTQALSNFEYKDNTYPRIAIKSLDGEMSAQNISFDASDIKAGKSIVPELHLKTGNIATLFDENKKLPMNIKGSALNIDANEWISATDNNDTEEQTKNEAVVGSHTYDYSKYDINWDLKLNKLVYEDYDIKDIASKGQFADNSIRIQDAKLKYEEAPMAIRGNIHNLNNYMANTGDLTGNLSFDGGKIDLNNLLPAGEEPMDDQSENTEEYILEEALFPNNINIDLNYRLDELIYGKNHLKNLKGDLTLKNAVAKLGSNQANTMGGKVFLEGDIDGSSNRPKYDLRFAVDKLKFPEMFESVVTVQMLAPLLKNMEGLFDGKFAFAGELQPNMFPDLSTISASGFLQTINAYLKGIQPFQKVDKLAGSDLTKGLNFQNTKNWFTIENGNVIIEPMPIKVNDASWTVEGSYGLDGNMNYIFNGPIKTSKLKQSSLGKDVFREASNILSNIPGMESTDLENIDVSIQLTGSYKSPKVSIKPSKAMASSIKDGVNAKVESEKQKVKDSLDRIKNEAQSEVKSTVKETKKEVKETGKKVVKDVLTGDKKGAEKNLDSLKNNAEDKLKEAKKKINKWNPFKKN